MVFDVLQKIGFVICHQIPERSFAFFGNPPCLCARCLGMYSSAFLMLGYFFGFKVLLKGERPGKLFSRRMYFFALGLILLLAVDAFLQYGGVYFSNVTRYLSGVAFGYGLSIFLVTLLSDTLSFKGKRVPLSKKELFGLAIGMCLMVFAVLAQHGTVLFFAHVLAAMGIVVVFISASLLLISLILEKTKKQLSLAGRLMMSCVVTAIGFMILYNVHLYYEDAINTLFKK